MSSVLLVLSITVIAAAQQPGLNNSTHMKNYTQDSGAIAGVLTDAYFKGIYEGNVDLLGSTFYDGALLFGDVKGQPYYKTLAQYLDGVRNRQSPKDSGKPFKGEITGIAIDANGAEHAYLATPIHGVGAGASAVSRPIVLPDWVSSRFRLAARVNR